MGWRIEVCNPEPRQLPGEWPTNQEAVLAALRYKRGTRAYEPEEPPEDIYIVGPDGKRLRLDVEPAVA